MTKLIVRTRDGAEKQLAPQGSHTVMEAIRDAGIDELLALCGGSCSCATCHVYVDESAHEALGPISEDESDLLDSSEFRRSNSRLSCQIRLAGSIDTLSVEIAPED